MAKRKSTKKSKTTKASTRAKPKNPPNGNKRKSAKKQADSKKARSKKTTSKKSSRKKKATAKKAASKPRSTPAKRSSSKASAKQPGPAHGSRAASNSAAPAKRSRAKIARKKEDAQSMASRQREISVSEFFTKNRHLLGFDNPQKALLTAVKEAVDNSLDACEEAGILPDIEVTISESGENRYRVSIQDNGPGIVKAQIPKIFGKLLYGSKFHRLKQQRGQQGIGISAAGMYGQLTTGRPVEIISRTSRRRPAYSFRIAIDTKKNAPVIQKETEVNWEIAHGTIVTLELEAVYKKGRRSVDEFIEQTALANPHIQMTYCTPKDEPLVYERVSKNLPEPSKEIKPHPYGVELGILMRMLKETGSRNLSGMLQSEFSRVSAAIAAKICDEAGLSTKASPKRLSAAQAEALFAAIPKVKIMSPPTACLSPVGEELFHKGMEERMGAQFFSAVTRPPAVYRGNPFQVEVAIAYGGELAGDDPIQLYRLANRVPLQYQQGGCAITKSVLSVDWKKYGVQQSRGALPIGPMAVFVHIASVWVPFTSESKEAVASYPEIIKELRLALQEAGRRVGIFVRKRKREADELKKRSYIEKYIPHIGDALQEILGLSDKKKDNAIGNLKTIMERSRKM